MTPRLVLLRDGQPPREIALDRGVFAIGRAPDGDLVLGDDTLSWRHAEVWTRGSGVYIRDRGSTNGTFLNGERVGVPVAAVHGDVLRLGPHVCLRVVGATRSGDEAAFWLVEEVGNGVRTPLPGGPWEAGAGAEASDRLALDAAGAPVLLSGGLAIPLMDGAEVRIRDVPLRILRAPSVPVSTAAPNSDRHPYRLSATVSGPVGPEATLAHCERPMTLTVSAENRAILLYVLTRRALQDRARSPKTALGWCPDEEIAVGIWGREGVGASPNTLHVLLHRVRRDIEAAGFDCGFIEKRRGATRITLSELRLD